MRSSIKKMKVVLLEPTHPLSPPKSVDLKNKGSIFGQCVAQAPIRGTVRCLVFGIQCLSQNVGKNWKLIISKLKGCNWWVANYTLLRPIDASVAETHSLRKLSWQSHTQDGQTLPQSTPTFFAFGDLVYIYSTKNRLELALFNI